MALTPEQIRQMYAGNGPMAMPAYTMEDIYGGVLPSMGGGNPALNAINEVTPTTPMPPASWNAYQGGVPVASSIGGAAIPSLPQRRPASAPTSMDMAAINAPAAGPQVNSVTGKMQPSTGYGGLLSILLGNSKNGLPGLAGLLGGPQQGGILQMLFGNQAAKAAPAMAKPMTLTPAQRYAAANSGPGSVAAMEAKHSGRPAGAYSDGREPSGTGSLW